MTPEELARRHPRLYHVARPGSVASIERLGLLSAEAICDRCGIDGDERERILSARRPQAVTVGGFTINDNDPINMAQLAGCLDDGLAPIDWLRLLNRKVFLWTREAHARRLAQARNNRTEPRMVLVFDTLSLTHAHMPRMAATPFNSGSAKRRPPRRGLDTFAPLPAMEFDVWKRMRANRGARRSNDAIVEIAIDYAVSDASAHLVDCIAL